jgi:hypothetical protein
MRFEKAMHDACKELGLDGHIKEIRFKKDASTYAERITLQFRKPPLAVKNSYLYLDCVNFCFFENRGECDFAISGYIHGNDKLDIKSAIEKALKLCELTTLKMAEMEAKDE